MNGWTIFYLVLIPLNAYEGWTTNSGFFWFMCGAFSIISIYELTER